MKAMEDIEKTISEVAAKDAKVLCREVLSITDTMDVLRSKWTVEVLTAIVCGNTRFKDIQEAVHGVSEKVLTDRLRQMQEDRLIMTDHGKRLFVIAYQMTEWGQEHRRLILDLPGGK